MRRRGPDCGSSGNRANPCFWGAVPGPCIGFGSLTDLAGCQRFKRRFSRIFCMSARVSLVVGFPCRRQLAGAEQPGWGREDIRGFARRAAALRALFGLAGCDGWSCRDAIPLRGGPALARDEGRVAWSSDFPQRQAFGPVLTLCPNSKRYPVWGGRDARCAKKGVTLLTALGKWRKPTPAWPAFAPFGGRSFLTLVSRAFKLPHVAGLRSPSSAARCPKPAGRG